MTVRISDARHAPNTPRLDDHVLVEEYEHLAGYGLSDQKIADRLGYSNPQYMVELVQRARERAA